MTTLETRMGTDVVRPVWDGLSRWVTRHRTSLKFVLPIFAVCAVIRFWNLSGSLGASNEDEGTYVAQAWAVLHGELAHYTYWYDHPPFGWIQIAGWAWLTNGFASSDPSILIGRQLVAVYAVIAGAVLYVLARRLGIARPFAAIGMVTLMVSPLALSWGRVGFLDGLTIPWILAAMVSARSLKRSNSAPLWAGIFMAGAILTKETAAVFVPVVLWMIWQNSAADRRRHNVIQSVALTGSIGVFTYVLMSVLKGELLPGSGHVSLVGSMLWQLVSREGSGSVFTQGDIAYDLVHKWLDLDWVLLVFGAGMLFVSALRKEMRPLVLAGIIHVVLLVRGGYLPIPFVITLLPLASLLLAGGLDYLWRKGKRHATTVKAGRITTIAIMGLFAVLAVPHWASQAYKAMTINDVAPASAAVEWIVKTSPASAHQQIVVDDSIWLDLILRGYDRDKVDWFYKLDADSAVMKRYVPADGKVSDAWKSIDIVAIPDIDPAVISSRPTLERALKHGTLEDTFGSTPGMNYLGYTIKK